MMKDLKDGSQEIPCRLADVNIVGEDEDSSSSVKLRLRKFRTCLNLLNSKLGNCLDDGDADKVMAEVKDWLAVVKEQADKVLEQVVKGQDAETDKMAEAVRSGLQVSSCKKMRFIFVVVDPYCTSNFGDS